MYAKVIIDIAAEQTDRLFTYRIPEGMQLCTGMRVNVPFRNYVKEGYILELAETCDYPDEKIKDVIGPLETYPALLPEMIDLAYQIKERYHATLCEALRLMLPVEMRGNRVHVKTELCVQLKINAAAVQEMIEKEKRSKRKRLFLTIISDGAVHSLREIQEVISKAGELAEELQKNGIIIRFDREVLRSPVWHDENAAPEPVLTKEQDEVLQELLPSVRDTKPHYFLLHGVTGSGKTEVYMRLVKHVLAEGGGAIILVPQIVLTPQMIDWFKARFGNCAAVLHSKLSSGERFDEWRRIRRGDASIVIGARSAIFAPIKDLKLVVVDEEHEQTYISEHFPQYDARDIAKMRIEKSGGAVVFASATPSIFSYAMARRGDYTLLQMPHRANGRGMPKVSIADMRQELRLGNKSMFSNLLLQKLRECMASGNQAMLFLNRRGYAPTVKCRRCGYTVKCSACDVSMTLHNTDGLMHCHYCGQKMPVPQKCPMCGSGQIRQLGIGTQKIEEELKKLFPEVGILRMDVDNTGTKNAYIDILNEFRSGRARILVGTQMIAKGLDFPRVTVVGAILADTSLELPDWRSPERTFQLLVQVAGRAGRADQPGEVIIQTYKPQHYVLQTAKDQDYRSFFAQEFDRRKKDLYPPFTDMVRVLCESSNQHTAIETAMEIQTKIEAFIEAHPILKRRLLYMHCDNCPIEKIQNTYRTQVLMKVLHHPDSELLLEHVHELTKETEKCKTYYEINPASLA